MPAPQPAAGAPSWQTGVRLPLGTKGSKTDVLGNVGQAPYAPGPWERKGGRGHRREAAGQPASPQGRPARLGAALGRGP